MHIMKCGKSDYSKIKGEACRDDGYHSRVGTINPELTEFNDNLIDREPPTDIDEYIKSLGVDRKIRADAVRCVSVIVDYPKDEKRSSYEFFTDAMKGLQEHFNIKDDAILYAQMHVDEGHEHMHFAFVPLVESEKTYKDGHTEIQLKLSAKEVLTRDSLQELHPFMQRYMEEREYEGTLYYGDDERRDKDFLEYKLSKIEAEIQNLEEEFKSWTDKNIQLEAEIQGQEATITSNSTEIRQQQAQIDSKSKELEDISDDLDDAKKTIANNDNIVKEFNQMNEKLDQVKAELDFFNDVPENQKHFHIGNLYFVDKVTVDRAAAAETAFNKVKEVKSYKKHLDERKDELDERERGIEAERTRERNSAAIDKRINDAREQSKESKEMSLLKRYQDAFTLKELEARERSRGKNKNANIDNEEREY